MENAINELVIFIIKNLLIPIVIVLVILSVIILLINRHKRK